MDGGVLVTLFKDYLDEEQLRKLGLNERQLRGLLFVKENGQITNSEYQKLNNVSKPTATRDFTELMGKFKLIKRSGGGGAGTYYTLIGS